MRKAVTLGSPRTGVIITQVHPETSILKQQTHQSGEPIWDAFTHFVKKTSVPDSVNENRKLQCTKTQKAAHRKSPDDFFVNDPGPLGTVSDTVMISKPTLNDLQSITISQACCGHGGNVSRHCLTAPSPQNLRMLNFDNITVHCYNIVCY